jgi:hypothetical protein
MRVGDSRIGRGRFGPSLRNRPQRIGAVELEFWHERLVGILATGDSRERLGGDVEGPGGLLGIEFEQGEPVDRVKRLRAGAGDGLLEEWPGVGGPARLDVTAACRDDGPRRQR